MVIAESTRRLRTANSSSVAEHALFLMLTLAKRGGELHVLVRAGRWAERMTAVPVDLLGKTVLVVGFGRTGTRVAKRCLWMEMTVIRRRTSRSQRAESSRKKLLCATSAFRG